MLDKINSEIEVLGRILNNKQPHTKPVFVHVSKDIRPK